MPIYEYTCMKCNKVFSVLQKVGASEKDTACSHCGSNDVKKNMSAFNSSSAGSGFSPSFSGFGGG